MSFDANWNKRINKEKAKIVISESVCLGRSNYVKDTYWTCYKLRDEYYIGLCDNDDIWEVEKSDIENYLEVTALFFKEKK